MLTGKSVDEKVAMCCIDYNNRGCSRGTQCKFMHRCSYVDRVTNRVCFNSSHSKPRH